MTVRLVGTGAGRRTTWLVLAVLLAALVVGGFAEQPAWAAGNVALNRFATGSKPCADDQVPAKAVNGSVSGGRSDRWCSRANGTKFLLIDLGNNFHISGYVVRHAGAGGESTALNTRAFTIETSLNATHFAPVVTVTANRASVTTHTWSSSNIRFVRLSITKPAQNRDRAARIYEFEVIGEPSNFPGENLALNRPATGSEPCDANQGPAKAVNGTITAGRDDKWCSRVAGPKRLTVDLQADRIISGALVRHAQAGGEPAAWNTRDFTVALSTDGVAFTTVATVIGNTWDTTFNGWQHRTARFVRLDILTPTSDGDPAARVYELEVYADVIPPPPPPEPPPPPAPSLPRPATNSRR